MKVQKFDTEEQWLEARLGRITGTRLGKLLSKRDKKPLAGYYELIAERVAIPHNGENVMDRGKRLEDDAIERFAKETGKKVKNDLVLWSREDDANIALSPDGVIGKTEAVEVKCLSSAAHIQAWLTKEIPDEYWHQVLQYFIVNDKLKKLHFVFYDPRMPKDFFYLTTVRAGLEVAIEEYLEMEKQVLAQVAEIEKSFTF
jgi:predicted phage-related endonuclease